MICEMCQAVVEKTFVYHSLMKFKYDRVCEFCRDRMKLEDWEYSCKAVPSFHPEPEVHHPRSI